MWNPVALLSSRSPKCVLGCKLSKAIGRRPLLHASRLFTLILVLQSCDLLAQNQRFLYVANWDPSSNSISGFSVDPTTGLLTPLPGFPVPANGLPRHFAVHPNNKFLYLSNEQAAAIYAYSIDPATGGLTAIPGSPFPAGPGSAWVILDPSGRFAYINSYLSNSVYGYTVDSSTGALTPIPGSPFPAQGVSGRDEPGDLATDPAGKFLFTPNYRSSTLTVYSINQVTGALQFVPGSPFPTPNSPGLGSGTTDPTGRFFYLTDLYLNEVDAWTINASGSLTSIPGSPFSTGPYTSLAQGYPYYVVIDRNGRFAYVTNEIGGTIAIYQIDPTSGALTPISGSPFSTGAGSGPGAFNFSPDGTLAYVTNLGGSISVYSVNSATGGLTLIPGAIYPTGTQPVAIAIVNGGPPPVLSPNHGGNAGSVTVQINGIAAVAGVQVKLAAQGEPDIVATNIVLLAASSLSATFNLTGAPIGPRDVVITPESGVPLTLSGAFTVGPAPACSYTVAPINPSFPASGGGGVIVVTSNVNTAECNFQTPGSFPTNVPWITDLPSPQVAIGGSGNPAEALEYQVAANLSSTSRSTIVSIAGQSVTVSQEGVAACAYNVTPANEIFAVDGGSAHVTVLTTAGCTWSATSSLSWVHITSGSSGSGNGLVTIAADPNTGGLRSGAITIAGKPFGVSQSASACGATDISSQVLLNRSPIEAGFIGQYYYQTVSLRNGPTAINGPVYLVLDGVPVTNSQCGVDIFGQPQTCGLLNAVKLTHCQSPSGSDMVLVSSSGLTQSQQISVALYFVPGPAGGAFAPPYKTRLFSGTPSQ